MAECPVLHEVGTPILPASQGNKCVTTTGSHWGTGSKDVFSRARVLSQDTAVGL